MVLHMSKFITALHKYYTGYYRALLPRILNHMCVNFERPLKMAIFEKIFTEIFKNIFGLAAQK